MQHVQRNLALLAEELGDESVRRGKFCNCPLILQNGVERN